MAGPINRTIQLDVSIHQHNGDPSEPCEIQIGDRPMIVVPAAAAGGRIREQVLALIKDLEI